MQNGTFDTDVMLGCENGEAWSTKLSGEWKWSTLLGSETENAGHLLYSINTPASEIKGTLDGLGTIPRTDFADLYKSHIAHTVIERERNSRFAYPNLINIRTVLTVYLPKGDVSYSYNVLTEWVQKPYPNYPMFQQNTCQIVVRDLKHPDNSFIPFRGYDHDMYLESKFQHWFSEHWLWVRRLFG